ncbi:MAG TPA: M20/M25/M40 family metallo-hydrolase [Gemmatimonadaceae bacterium]|nr:M20/M25/M40 family metallo-hydrolase [Gemmatimonadaceae bacterium]
MIRIVRLSVLIALGSSPLLAQNPRQVDGVRTAVREWRVRNEPAILRELSALLAIPNLASDSVSIRRNADTLVAMLTRRGITARRVETPGSPPGVYGELRVPGATRTIVMYAHYDGQPVDPARWATPPWAPTLRDAPLERNGRIIPLPDRGGELDDDARLYARSSSDDKAPIVAMLSAIDALRAARIPLSVNLKFFLEGEEEAGSDHLAAMLRQHAGLLSSDGWIFGDGPVHQSRRPQIVFGVRGVMGADLTVYGPARALHSGHYGNWAPNPSVLLAHLLASMRDTEGRITIAGFLDEVRAAGTLERAAIARAPAVDTLLRRELALGDVEGDSVPLLERIMLPALNVRGLDGGPVGGRAANVIPTQATASIDFRLVPNQTPARVRELVEAHVRRQGYHIVHHEPTLEERARHARVARVQWEQGYPGIRTDMDAPLSRAVSRVVSTATNGQIVAIPMLGGSLPMYLFAEILNAPLVIVPIVNHDNNQHAANENLRIGNLREGIELYAQLFARLGTEWR